MSKIKKRAGFTLIELLVVIAIIAILSGLIFPAVSLVLRKGIISTAQTEVKSIESALNAYLSDYGKFPRDSGTDDKIYGRIDSTSSGEKDNRDIIKALRGLDPATNPRRINYLEVSQNSLSVDGDMLDPWQNQYFIALNTDFDTILNVGTITNLEGRNIAVWTMGDPKRPEMIKSW